MRQATRYVIARTEAEAEMRMHHTSASADDPAKLMRLRRAPNEHIYPVTVTIGEPLEEPTK